MPIAAIAGTFLADAHRLGVRSALIGIASKILSRRLTLAMPSGGEVTIRSRNSDYATFRQIFATREYDLSGTAIAQQIAERYAGILAAGGVPVIVDAGANVGFAALWFARLYPQAKIVSIEPDPANFDLLSTNVRGQSQVLAVHAAIGAAAGFVQLSNQSMGWATQTTRVEAAAGIPIMTVDQAIAEVPNGVPLIVKIDIEGFEQDLFSDNLQWLDKAYAVFVEPHDWMDPSANTSRAFQREFGRRDFNLYIRGENLLYVSNAPDNGAVYSQGQTLRAGDANDRSRWPTSSPPAASSPISARVPSR